MVAHWYEGMENRSYSEGQRRKRGREVKFLRTGGQVLEGTERRKECMDVSKMLKPARGKGELIKGERDNGSDEEWKGELERKEEWLKFTFEQRKKGQNN